MSELAYDLAGHRFEVPSHVKGWRIHRVWGDGSGEQLTITGKEGRPMILPVDADSAELYVAVAGAPGRYRLEPIDATGRVLADAASAFVEVGRAVHPFGRTPYDVAMIELVRANSEAVRANSEAVRANSDIVRAHSSAFQLVATRLGSLTEALLPRASLTWAMAPPSAQLSPPSSTAALSGGTAPSSLASLSSSLPASSSASSSASLPASSSASSSSPASSSASSPAPAPTLAAAVSAAVARVDLERAAELSGARGVKADASVREPNGAAVFAATRTAAPGAGEAAKLPPLAVAPEATEPYSAAALMREPVTTAALSARASRSPLPGVAAAPWPAMSRARTKASSALLEPSDGAPLPPEAAPEASAERGLSVGAGAGSHAGSQASTEASTEASTDAITEAITDGVSEIITDVTGAVLDAAFSPAAK
jgi:hypothetical protein